MGFFHQVDSLDDTGGLGSFDTPSDCPCSNLVWSTYKPSVNRTARWHVRRCSLVKYRIRSSEAYPDVVILPNAEGFPFGNPNFSASSSLSSSDMLTNRSSRATENGMSASPGLFSSIQALILGSHLFFLRMKSRSDRLTRYVMGLAVSSVRLLMTSTWRRGGTYYVSFFPILGPGRQLERRKVIRDFNDWSHF